MTSHKKKSKLINYIPNVIITIGALIILILAADIKDYRFWIASIIAIGLAFTWEYVRRHSYWISNFILLFSVVAPILVAANISSLKPVGISFFTFLAAAVDINLYFKYHRRLKNRTNSIKLSPNFPFPAIFPAFLPERLIIDDYHISKKNQQTTVELNYRDDGDVVLWIYEANGLITRDKVKLPEQKSDKIIKGTTVTLRQEILADTQSLYLEAAWSRNDINFNLASEGIALEEVEKIIASMIQEKVS
jgi:hypothetical protein